MTNQQNNDFENENNNAVPSRDREHDEKAASKTPVKKKNKALKVFCIIGIVLISILVIIAIILSVLIFKGKQNAIAENKDAAQNIQVQIGRAHV